MKRIEYRNVLDRSEWDKGEWDNEPDKIQWQDEATGLPCLIKRSPFIGILCGYVGVTSDHPYYGEKDTDVDVDVHGGLTFANSCSHGPEDTSICHVVEEGEPDDVWWLGFDCGHAFDRSPSHDFQHSESVYRNIAYVENEVRNLARQLAELGK